VHLARLIVNIFIPGTIYSPPFFINRKLITSIYRIGGRDSMSLSYVAKNYKKPVDLIVSKKIINIFAVENLF